MAGGACVEAVLGATPEGLAGRALEAACRAVALLEGMGCGGCREAAGLVREMLAGGRILVVGGLLAVSGEPLPAVYVEEDGVIAVSPHALEDPGYAARAIAAEALKAASGDPRGLPGPEPGAAAEAASALAAAGCVADLAEAGPHSPLAALQVAGEC